MTNHPTDSYGDAFVTDALVEEDEDEEPEEPLVIEYDFGGRREE